MKNRSNNPAVIRFYELSALLSAQSHARVGYPRTEMIKLMLEYDELKNSDRSAWDEFCRLRNNPNQENHTHYY